MIKKSNHFRIKQTIHEIRRNGIIAILRGDYQMDNILRIAETLVSTGISVLEITLNSSDSLKVIESLRGRYKSKELLLGAGTVRTVQQMDWSVEAGVSFAVSPNLDIECGKRASLSEVLYIPGVLSSTEVETAFRAGHTFVKLFPADLLGPKYIKALRAPFDNVEFIPTGGINTSNLSDFIKAGSFAVGVGSSLLAGPKQKLTEIQLRARSLRKIWDRGNGY